MLAADFIEAVTLAGARMYILAVIEHAIGNDRPGEDPLGLGSRQTESGLHELLAAQLGEIRFHAWRARDARSLRRLAFRRSR